MIIYCLKSKHLVPDIRKAEATLVLRDHFAGIRYATGVLGDQGCYAVLAASHLSAKPVSFVRVLKASAQQLRKVPPVRVRT